MDPLNGHRITPQIDRIMMFKRLIAAGALASMAFVPLSVSAQDAPEAAPAETTEQAEAAEAVP